MHILLLFLVIAIVIASVSVKTFVGKVLFVVPLICLAILLFFYEGTLLTSLMFIVGEFYVMETLFGSLFLVDGVFLWLALGIFAVLTLVTVEYEKPGWCTVLIAIAVGFMQFYTAYHPVTFAIQYPLYAVTIVALYFAAGTGWIVLKWLSHVYSVRDRFNTIKQSIIDELKTFKVSATNTTGYIAADGTLTADGVTLLYERAARRLGETNLPLKVNDHKGQLYMWWICWPLSLFWTVLNDPIKRLWWFIYNQIGGLLQGISDRAFKI